MIQSDARRDVIRLSPEWLSLLRSEFTAPHMTALRAFLKAEKAAGKVIYPPGNEFFAALDATPPDEVKVVILGGAGCRDRAGPLPRSSAGTWSEFFG